jgi:hypothetical protein
VEFAGPRILIGRIETYMEQARSTPTVSALSISGLIKHVTLMEYSWTLTVAAPSEPFPGKTPYRWWE